MHGQWVYVFVKTFKKGEGVTENSNTPNADDLRRQTQKYHDDEQAQREAWLREREAKDQKELADVERKLQEAAQAGLREAVVWTVSQTFREDLIALPDNAQYDWLEDDRETIDKAIDSRKHLPLTCLRGHAAALRDQLQTRGFRLELRLRTEGSGCKGSYHVWDIVARW